MNQKEILSQTLLLNHKGQLNFAGYARTMLFSYNRREARSFPLRLKEWNFYQFIYQDYVLQMTIGHVSYAASITVTLLDIKTGQKEQASRMRWLYNPKLDIDPENDSCNEFVDGDFHMSFRVAAQERVLTFKGKDKAGKDIDILLTVENDVQNEKMVIATPFKERRQFYLNYKENYYVANGHVIIGDLKVDFVKATGLLDWGRGIWPCSHEWFWGSATAFIGEVPFGLNIGWGFGDLSNATENMFFYDKKAYKLGTLEIMRDKDDYMSPWHAIEQDGKLEFTFVPIYDNYTENKFLIIDTHCHQVYGYFSGSIRIPTGEIKFSQVFGFIEHAVNRW